MEYLILFVLILILIAVIQSIRCTDPTASTYVVSSVSSYKKRGSHREVIGDNNQLKHLDTL